MRRRALLAGLTLLLCAPFAATALAAPTLTATPASLRADSTGLWSTDLMLSNAGGTLGLFADSLVLFHRTDALDRTGRPASGRNDLSPLARMLPPISAGDSARITYGAPAEFDRGTLRFVLHSHDANNVTYASETVVTITGSDFSDAHPAIVIEAGKQRTDMVLMRAATETKTGPTVLIVPPAGVAARSLMRWSHLLLGRGYHVAIVSLPGAGRANGDWDGAGPGSVALVRAAVARLRTLPGVDPARIVLWGDGEGADVALLAAAAPLELSGVFALNPDLDPWAAYRGRAAADQAAYAAAAGRDSSAWQARSALAVATRITAPVLILQTQDARMGDPAPAEAFAAARSARDLYVETRLSSREPRPLRRTDVTRLALGFLGRRLGD
jgi:hypothetical protein